MSAMSPWWRFYYFVHLFILIGVSVGQIIHTESFPNGKIEEYKNGTFRINEHLWVYECNGDQAKQIYDSLEEAKQILGEVKSPNLDRYSAQEYLGAQHRLDWQTYNDKIREVFKAADQWANRYPWFAGPYVYCESEKRKCDLDEFRATPIKVEYPDGNKATDAQLTLVMCDRWFQAKSLKVVIAQGKFCKENYPQEDIQIRTLDMRWYENRAFWFVVTIFYLREVHVAMTSDYNPHLGPNPRPAPNIFHGWPTHDCIWATRRSSKRKVPALAPWSAKKLGTNKAYGELVSSGPLGNPTNYGLFSLAEYITKQIGDYPDRPYIYNTKYSWWAPRGDRMCAGFDPQIMEASNFRPNMSTMAISPWVFSLETPPDLQMRRRDLIVTSESIR